MTTRRRFIKSSIIGSSAVFAGLSGIKAKSGVSNKFIGPHVVSTWRHGLAANSKAWEILKDNGSALDAVEAGVMVSEGDPKITSVGYGGTPDRDGHVTLDACIMDSSGNAGSVAFIEHIMHPISVARKVMELTPHVMLVGEGALEFALEHGHKKENLLTKSAKKRWEKWLEEHGDEPVEIDDHDTIGMVAIDAEQNLAGACTTSGLSFKLHGRVGDSPIIGAGMYVDNEVGAAAATGVGEEVIKIAGSFLVVELMRGGLEPEEACKEACRRIALRNPDWKDLSVAFIAINKNGTAGAYSLLEGFQMALQAEDKAFLHDVPNYR